MQDYRILITGSTDLVFLTSWSDCFVQSLTSATGLFVVPSVRCTCKLLLGVHYEMVLGLTNNKRSPHFRTLFPSYVLQTGSVTAYMKLVRWNLLKSGSKKNLGNRWTSSYQLFEARSLARQKRLRYPSCPSFLLPSAIWARLPLEVYPWKFILQSFVKSAAKFETWLQLDKTIGKFTRRLN
jgi:hypothetical protein